jgi:predicted dehydrogenase
MTGCKKVAVVGCGYWGKNLVRNFAALDALSMVCDANLDARRFAAGIAPETAVVSDFDKVLSSSVDGVVVATPAETHFDLGRRALEAGKDVFIEKPLALTYADGVQLVKLAKDCDRILMVGHVLEYHPGIVKLLDMVECGELGELQYIYSDRLSLGKFRREENILWSFAPHDIAVILRMIGEMPAQISAYGGSYVQPNIADVTVTHMRFDNGIRAHIHVSWLHPFKSQRLVVIGSRRMASFDDVAKRLVLYNHRIEMNNGEPISINGIGEDITFASSEPLREECIAFLNAIALRRPPVTDGQSALNVLSVLEAAQESLAIEGMQVVPPVDVTLDSPSQFHGQDPI